MIRIDLARCDGCGACVEVCPAGALYLIDDKAMLEAGLCRACEACVAACPMEAIAFITEEAAPAGVAVVQARPVSRGSRLEAAVVPLRAKVLPLVGTALTWAGREIVPRLVDGLLYNLDRWAMGQRGASGPGWTPSSRTQNGRGQSRGHRRRQRRRGQ